MRPHRGMLLSVICLTMAVVSCNRGDSDARQGVRIGLVLKTLNSPFFIEMQRGASEAANRLGVALIVQAAEREVDVDKQMQIIENLIETGVNALCITPSGSKEIVSAIAKANRANIPVVILDTRVDRRAAEEASVRIASFVGSDNYAGGRLAGEHLIRLSGGRARVAILEGIPGHETGDSRLRGFRDAVKQTPGIEIVASQTANWERDQGFNVSQNLLQAHPNLDAIFACNDMMALGAVEAIAAAGKTGRVQVIGFDAVEDARKAIVAGTIAASIAQFPDEMGRVGVENAVRVVRGETVEPDVQVRIELVTKANLIGARDRREKS
jgi:ribose transport system substrate-binding protein